MLPLRILLALFFQENSLKSVESSTANTRSRSTYKVRRKFLYCLFLPKLEIIQTVTTPTINRRIYFWFISYCAVVWMMSILCITSFDDSLSVPFSIYFKSGQNQFSRNNIYTHLREKVMRINQLITKGKVLWSFNKISELISWEMFGGEFGEFACGYWGLLRVIWNLLKWWSLKIVKVIAEDFKFEN